VRASTVIIAAILALMSTAVAQEFAYYPVQRGDFPHDVAAGPSGEVWYAGQRAGVAGRLDPTTGHIERIPLGDGAAPQGVIVGPDGAPWFTDGGRNAIVRLDAKTKDVKVWALPRDRKDAELNTAAFDRKGRIWFTGQAGIYGRLEPTSGEMKIWDAPMGSGPYGMTATPHGDIWFVSFAKGYLASVDLETGTASLVEPPTKDSGTRRVWSDSRGRLWVSEWNSGNLALFDPEAKSWKEWKLPGPKPQAYAVWVDPEDAVWVSEWSANAVLRFNPANETFLSFPSDQPKADVRQILGREGEVWIAESGTDRIRVIRYRTQKK
jgi:virginiamycin B lyase